MSLILCPECGSRISDRACVCPRCGYFCDDPALPISAQESYELAPVNVSIEVWGQGDCCDLAPIMQKDKNSISEFICKAERFEKLFPSVAANVKELMAAPETEYLAKLTPELRRLIDEGKLSFKLDKNGELMAILQNGKSRITNQIRLEEVQFDKGTAQSLSDLTTTAMLGQVLDEIQEVQKAIGEIHAELQDDRLALAEAARERLLQASRIQDPELRSNAILLAIGAATDSKHMLMRNFARNRIVLEEDSSKSVFAMMLDKPGKGAAQTVKAEDAMDDLSLMAAALQVECMGWALLGERDSAAFCLQEFGRFINANKLGDRNTLIMINESAGRNCFGIAKKFEDLSKGISLLEEGHCQEASKAKRLAEGGLR